ARSHREVSEKARAGMGSLKSRVLQRVVRPWAGIRHAKRSRPRRFGAVGCLARHHCGFCSRRRHDLHRASRPGLISRICGTARRLLNESPETLGLKEKTMAAFNSRLLLSVSAPALLFALACADHDPPAEAPQGKTEALEPGQATAEQEKSERPNKGKHFKRGHQREIGRASCRERAELTVDAVSRQIQPT